MASAAPAGISVEPTAAGSRVRAAAAFLVAAFAAFARLLVPFLTTRVVVLGGDSGGNFAD